ncbi:MAG TPA: TIR domain-containing protein, partial [Blastocatellia bacterium]|nr:TIR domain-containing protein [Blastocatellia bacterium]
MCFVPGYEHDIFISYAHHDNSTHKDGKPNWVGLLENYIRARARGRGHELNIYRDAQLSPFTGVNRQLADSIAQSAIFLCVVSPNYAKSKWCLWELERAIESGRLDCLLRIGKYPLDDAELQPKQKELLQQTDHLLEARFYASDESKKSVEDLQPELFAEHLSEFYKRLNPIVDKIIERLKELRAANTSQAKAETRVAVYLAETSKDLAGNERELIRSELAQFNYRVLPDKPLPREAGKLLDAIRQCLQQTKLSIHLIGASYGDVLDGEDSSIPHLQYDLADEMRKQGQLSQIVWLPPNLTPKGKLQQDFVANLKDTSPDYSQTTLEDLKSIIRRKLTPTPTVTWPEEDDNEDPNQIKVCLFCHKQDEENVGLLYSHLRYEEGFKINLSLPNVQSQQILQDSDGVLLFYGEVEENWVVSKWNIIRRHLATIKDKQIPTRAIFAAKPPTMEKRLLAFKDLLILKHYDDFTPEAIAPFV